MEKIELVKKNYLVVKEGETMTSRMININRLKEIIKSGSYSANKILKDNLELLIVVDTNYSHISQLESTVNLLEMSGASFAAESDEKFVCRQTAIIGNNTRWNHYNNDEVKPGDAYDLYLELFGNKDLHIRNFKSTAYGK